MIKAVTFDFWNTLYADVNFNERLRKRVEYIRDELGRLGYDRRTVEVERAFEMAGKKWLEMWGVESRSFSPQEITEDILNNLDLNMPSEIAINMSNGIGQVALKVPPAIVEGVKEVLQELSKECRIGLISDTAATPGAILRKIMARDGIEKYFSSFVFSDELASTKPNRLNFEKALQDLKIKPEQSVHIGDMDRTDIAGAKAVGMKAILFTGINNKDVNSNSADMIITSYQGLKKRLSELTSNG